MDMSWSQQKAFAGVVLVGILYLQVSAWDEADFARLREDAARAKADGVRYLVEQSGHRDAYASAFHCRAPRKGERLAMQHADARDPGKGYRCTYWMLPTRNGQPLTVTWSRSPEVVRGIHTRIAP